VHQQKVYEQMSAFCEQHDVDVSEDTLEENTFKSSQCSEPWTKAFTSTSTTQFPLKVETGCFVP
jgi:hypothetical protein